MTRWNARITVRLKRDVADVQGLAIAQALARHGRGVEEVHVGKVFDVRLSAADRAAAENLAAALAKDTFSNPVIEDFTLELSEA